MICRSRLADGNGSELTDPSLSAVCAAPNHVVLSATELGTTLVGRLLDRAHAAGSVRGTTKIEAVW